MLAYRAQPAQPSVVHFQWLASSSSTAHCCRGARPLVLTAHDILPREPRPGQRRAQQRLYRRFDAIVVHSRHGARRLVGSWAWRRRACT